MKTPFHAYIFQLKLSLLGGIIAAISFGELSAQTPLGLKAGFQSTALTREGSVLNNEIPNFMLGMFFHPISKHPVTGEFEILVSRKGSSGYASTYLEVPILVNFKIAKRLFIGGGGYAAANIGSPEDVNFQFIDLGYIIEAGYWMDRVELGIRFEKAMSNSFSLNFLDYKNRVWAFYLGYHL